MLMDMSSTLGVRPLGEAFLAPGGQREAQRRRLCGLGRLAAVDDVVLVGGSTRVPSARGTAGSGHANACERTWSQQVELPFARGMVLQGGLVPTRA